jgi:hypothetical protein
MTQRVLPATVNVCQSLAVTPITTLTLVSHARVEANL